MRRRNRFFNSNKIIVEYGGFHFVVGHKGTPHRLGVQGFVADPFSALPRPQWYPGGVLQNGGEYTGGGYATPPHVKLHRDRAFAQSFPDHHLRYAYFGWQLRSVGYWPRKPGRMDGSTRRKSAADYHYFRHGFYRDDDPLLRSPSESGIASGSESADDPGTWPSGWTPFLF
jgi:hypothetical protein